MIERLVDLLAPIFGEWGLVIVFLATFLETSAFLGLLVPGESIVILAGIMANETFRSQLGAPPDLPITIQEVVVVTILGVVAGDTVGYILGRFKGREIARRRQGRFINPGRLAAAEDYYRSHGGKTVFLGRFTPFLRSLGALVAGMSGMSYPRFAAYEFAGALLWGTGIPLIGFFFGRYGTASLKAIDRFLKAPGFAILLVVAIVVFVYVRRRRRAVAVAQEEAHR